MKTPHDDGLEDQGATGGTGQIAFRTRDNIIRSHVHETVMIVGNNTETMVTFSHIAQVID